MKKFLIEYIREEGQCNYVVIYDYFKDLSDCDSELKVKYLLDLFMYIYEQEQLKG